MKRDPLYRRMLGVTALIAASLMLVSPASSACSCAPYPADESKAAALAYGQADAIFVGVVTNLRSGTFRILPTRDAEFDVLRSWKGLPGRESTVVRTAAGEIACGFTFRKGGHYLVFAHWNEKQQILWTNICELTRKASAGKGLIGELDDLIRRRGTAGR